MSIYKDFYEEHIQEISRREKTIDYAKSVINVHEGYCNEGKYSTDTEKAYTKGLKDMFEILTMEF